ncbi:MAG TPA: hypothetical protein VKJ77_16970 [Caballeronia sp.]|nr:hypothetical protein [Caballeronia sp.]
MPNIRRIAADSRVTVEFADLGDWDDATLVSEYKGGKEPVIRINSRVVARYRRVAPAGVQALVDLAIAHELYHHYEAIGKTPRIRDRGAREAAADAFAREHVTVDPQLDAFLESGCV